MYKKWLSKIIKISTI